MAADRKNLGEISRDLSMKAPESRDPIELQREMTSEYMDNLIECINTHKKVFPQDFYVVVITKRERLMDNVLRNYFTARLSCPTPEYDQAVYKYDAAKEELSFLWVVPSKDASELLKANATQVPKTEQELLHFVLRFFDGDLLKCAKRLNGESETSPLLV